MKTDILTNNHTAVDQQMSRTHLRPDSMSSPCRCHVLAILLVCLTVFGVGNAWGAAATLPVNYSFGDGKDNLPTGVSQNSLGSNYAVANSPYRLKFDNDNDYIQIQVDAAVNTITVGIKEFSASGAKVQIQGCTTSGGSYSEIQTLSFSNGNNKKGSQSTNVSISSDYRYFRIKRVSGGGNFGLGTLAITGGTAYTVSFNTGAGNPSVADRPEASAGAGITLPSTSDLTPACSGDGWVLYGWATAAYGSASTTAAPTTTLVGLAGTAYNPTADITLYAVYRKINGSPSSTSITYTINGNWTTDNGNWTIVSGALSNLATGKWGINSGSTSATSPASYSEISEVIFTGTKSGSGAGSVEFFYGSESSWTSLGSKSMANTLTWSVDPVVSGDLKIVFTRTNGNIYIASIKVTYSNTSYYYWSAPTCASCDADPTIGAASLNGSFNSGGVTSLTNTVSFSTTSCDPNTNCEWVDYGFVWGTSASPTVSNTKMQKGTDGDATSWDMTSPSTFSVNTTYKVRAYGKNGKTGAEFVYSSSDLSFTPRSVAFNSNGGSAVATKYIKSGGAMTAPTAPTKTGYNFDSWRTDAGLGTEVSWPSTINASTTYYAKWNAKTYAITLNANGGSGSSPASVNATYNAHALSSAITNPTKTDYIFQGWNTKADGSGLTVIGTDGALIASVSGYTDGSGNWTKDGTETLYAKWTEHTYTNYRTSCCTELATISGSFASSTSSSATVTWTIPVDGSSNKKAAGVILHLYADNNNAQGAEIVGKVADYSSDNTTTSHTFTGLDASTKYWFTIEMKGTTAGGVEYCDAEEGAAVSFTTAAAACVGLYSLHTGNSGQGGWISNQCFEDADWGAADDAIYVGAFPLTNECYVGWAGGNSYHGTYWAVGGIKTYDIPTGRTLGWNSGNYYESYPGGALGTFHIYKNSTDENYYLRFKPSSYILRTGSDGTSWTSREMTVSATNSHYYETAELDLTSTLISEHAYVDLKTNGGDGHVWCNFSNDRTASGNVKVKSSVGDADGNFRGDNLKASDNGTHGKFRIDVTKDVDNWKLAFVPMYRITYAPGTGASGSMDPSSYAEISTTIAAAAEGFTDPTGKQFNGWSDGVNSYAAGANVTMNSNVTLTAQWTDIDYTVTVSQSPDVSATTTGQTSSAHYNGTINLTVTDIPSGYRFVNWTTSDGFSITNSTSATTASFTMPAKNVTVTANFQQTHKVDWYVGGSAPANKIGDDGQTTVVDHGGKISAFPATTPDGSPCDKTFVGWTNTSSYVHGTSPLFNDVAGSPVINTDASFYAVFAEVTGGTDYEQVTSLDDIHDGPAYFAYYGSYSGSRWYGVNSVSTITAPVTVSEGVLTTSTGDYTLTEFTIVTVDAANHIYYIKIGDDYVIGSSSGEKTDLSLDDAPYAWTFESINSTTYNMQISHTYTTPSTTCYMKAGVGTAAGGKFRSYPTTGQQISLFQTTGSFTGHTINCANCGTSVTPTYTAAPTGGTVSVTKSATPVTSGSTVKTCTAVDLSVTITPASHYTLTGFTATGLTTGTATISPAVNTVVPTTSAQTFTVTVSAGATGTLNLTPTFTEDAHKVISWVVHGGSASIADGHGTTWVYSGENLTAIPDAPDAPTGCDDKVFVGWSENDRGATEEDASYYDDLFTMLGGAPTGITTDKTFTAVFATPAAGMGGTVMWEEPWTGASASTQPSGTTGYSSTAITYSYSESGCKIYADELAGGTSPELLIKESGGNFSASNIPTASQTSLTLTYKSNKSLTVSTNTSGVTVGDADVDGSTYTRTITINQSGLGVANFDLVFTKTGKNNARLDDIHVAVPGSSSMSGYVTTCEDTWTVTYYKNTEDAVTNLPSPTGISKSTGSGTLSSKVPVRYGYTFDGWATSAGGSVAYAAGAAVSSVSADMDLYAKWSVTPVTEINLSKTSLDKYVGDPSVILSVLSVLPDGANTSVTWSSSNSSIATVNSSTGEVNFVAEGTANIIATSTITSGTTATCVVTVWAKPSVSFLDNLHSLTEDKDGNALSGYNLTDVAGTPVVFPILANQSAGSGTCEDEHYVFVGWTTSDNNTDPEDHLVTSHNLTNGDNITYYAVWADGVAGTTYTKLTNSTFKTSPAKYVIGAEYNGTTRYFYSCEKTDKNNSWGYVTADLASNTPIEFTLSGTAAALVATSTEVSARYLKPLATKDFQLSASSQTVELKSDGTIYNNNVDETDWRLLYNMAGGLRWYSSTVSGSASAYFYEVVAGGEVNYRTSCCADKVAAPSVTATKTSTTVTLTWAAVSGATGYELQWNGGAWTAATSGVVKSDLTPNTNYSWRVRATYVPPKCGADIASGSTTTNQVYHVTYAKGSGTGSCNATGSTTDDTAYEAGATVTLQSNGFTLVGHTFNEWTEDDEDITISSNQFTMPEHDVVITATWTPKVDKFYDRMHDGTDASHGGIADGDGKYYITREGCSYTVPSLTDNTSGATACHTKHYVLMGWTAESHLNSDGTLKTGHEGYVYTGGGTQTATGATYYAVWAEVEE